MKVLPKIYKILFPLIFIGDYLYIFQIFSITTHGVTYFEMFLGILYILFFFDIIWNGRSLRICFGLPQILVLLLLASALVSSYVPILSGNILIIIQNIKSTIHFIFLISFVIVASTDLFDYEDWDRVFKTILYVSILVNIFAAYQLAARAYDLPLAWLPITNESLSWKGTIDLDEVTQLSLRFGNFYRATSIFSEPSALAGYNLHNLIYLSIPFFQRKKSFIKSGFLRTLCFIWILIALFLTFSLTALTGIILLLIGVIILERKTIYKSLFIILFVSIFIIIISDTIVENYFDISVTGLFYKRVSSIVSQNKYDNSSGMVGESFNSRVEDMKASVQLWESMPITGIGLGATIYNDVVAIGYSDTSFLQALSELGIFGGLIFISMFLFLITRCFKNRNKFLFDKRFNMSEQRLMGISFYIIVIQFLIAFFIGNSFIGPSLWLNLALIFYSTNNVKIRNGSKYYEISLFRKPLKEIIYKNLSYYILSKNQDKK